MTDEKFKKTRVIAKIPKPAIKRIMKDIIGSERRISDMAVEEFSNFIELLVRKIIKDANQYSIVSGRKTLKIEDLDVATRELLGITIIKPKDDK